MKRESINYGAVRLADGTIDAGLYVWPHNDFCRSFCERHEYALTGDEVLCALPLWVQGRTYQEKKENLRDLAVGFQHAIQDIGMSYGEISEASAFFEEQGRRYGLLAEFRENLIC